MRIIELSEGVHVILEHVLTIALLVLFNLIFKALDKQFPSLINFLII